ncbi:hypothetical protein QTL95_16295 [Rhizobium sp. S152]|uniref:hypothetical protein n=1 Tax=Rhizobium sp. S152 TaxID=3055038 RepID=UPI0025A986A8|nr:hypothetical protein [Rhizobium sp. S152]MDM9627465.1 hypothetical protein [Rhizobium sp. S152]
MIVRESGERAVAPHNDEGHFDGSLSKPYDNHEASNCLAKTRVLPRRRISAIIAEASGRPSRENLHQSTETFGWPENAEIAKSMNIITL